MDTKFVHNERKGFTLDQDVVSFVFLSVLCAPLFPVYRKTQKHFTNDF